MDVWVEDPEVEARGIWAVGMQDEFAGGERLDGEEEGGVDEDGGVVCGGWRQGSCLDCEAWFEQFDGGEGGGAFA